jgi:hypothetical protein
VYDTSRSSSATILVTVQAADKPLVTVTSAVSLVNPVDQLVVVTGVVNLVTSGSSVWTINDTNVDLSSASSSAVTHILATGISTVTLTLKSNYLQAGSTLAFTLSATGTVTPASQPSLT